jgi:hypothetical protein
MYMYIHVYTCIFVHVYMCMYIHVYTCIYMALSASISLYMHGYIWYVGQEPGCRLLLGGFMIIYVYVYI